MEGHICRHLSSFSVSTQSLISLRIASFDVRLAIRKLENIFDKVKLKASVYKSAADGKVTIVVSVFRVDGAAGTERAVDGTASSASRTLNGVECFSCMRVSLSEFDIIKTF